MSNSRKPTTRDETRDETATPQRSAEQSSTKNKTFTPSTLVAKLVSPTSRADYLVYSIQPCDNPEECLAIIIETKMSGNSAKVYAQVC